MTIGEAIRKIRTSKKASLTAIEKKTGISKSNLSKIETNKIKDLRLSTLKKIANALEVPIYAFFSEVPLIPIQKVYKPDITLKISRKMLEKFIQNKYLYIKIDFTEDKKNNKNNPK